MLSELLGWSLRHRVAVLVAWAAVATLGAWSLLRLPLDAFPDTTPVQVQVNTTAPSLGPLEVERQLTIPLEQALGGLPGLAEMRSLSKPGLSQVTLVFVDGADVWRARQVTMERVEAVALPESASPPRLGPVATGLGEVFHYLVRGGRSLGELRAAQERLIAPRLRAVPGVAEVNTWGGEERRIEVLVDPAALQAHGLTVGEVVQGVEQGHGLVGGGPLAAAGEATRVRGEALLRSVDDVAGLVLQARDGTPLRLGDVARVVEGRAPRHGAVTADGRGEVVLGLGFLLLGENSREVAQGLVARLEEVRRSLPAEVEVEPVHVRTALVDQVLDTVWHNLASGALLVVAVLLVLLGSWRAGLVVAVVIPLSMLFAGNLMLTAGVTGSLMSLGAIDFGLVVDSSIVVVENAMRRLAERPQDDPLDVVRDAAVEVRRPTLFGELIILAVYLPVLTLVGTEGRMFRPMAWTVVFALLGSLLASLTLVPVLASLGLRAGHGDNALVRGLKVIYRPVLAWSLRHVGALLLLAGVVLGNAAFLASRLGTEFIPRLAEGTIVINTVRLASVSLDQSVAMGTRVEQALLRAFPEEIERVWSRTGAAEVATDPMGVELTDIFLALRPRERWARARTQAELVEQIEAELSGWPGMRAIYTQPIEMRISELAAGVRSDLGVKIFGDDLDRMREKAKQIEQILRETPGAADVVVEQVTGLPTLRVEVDPLAAGRRQLSPRAVLEVVEAVGGLEAGEIVDGEWRVPVAVRVDPALVQHPTELARLAVAGPEGQRLPLSALTRLVEEEGPSTIQREDGRRRLIVQANVRGRDLGSFVQEVAGRVEREVDRPDGWFIRYGGQFEHYEQARDRLLLVVPLALGLIAGLLWLTYGRLLDALRVFTGVPFAAVGGVVALWLADLPLSVSAAVGFIALSGVAVLGDMVLVSTIRRNLDDGLDLHAAVTQAAEERLRPVLTTSLVAALGFLPMMMATGVGAEVQRPLATVVVGGLVSSTLLTLVVLPALYTRTRRAG